MTPEWRKYIRGNQLIPTIIRKGIEVERIRYGSEPNASGTEAKHRRGCHGIKGEIHVWSCVVERCPVCEGHPWACACVLCDEDAKRRFMKSGRSLPWVNYWADEEE